MARIPEVRGRPYDEVAAELVALGLRPVRITRPLTEYYEMRADDLDDIALGADAVLGANPAAGSLVAPGSSVVLTANPGRNVDDPTGRHDAIADESAAQAYVAAIRTELTRVIPCRDEDVAVTLTWAGEASVVVVSIAGGPERAFSLFGPDLDSDFASPRPASYVALLIRQQLR